MKVKFFSYLSSFTHCKEIELSLAKPISESDLWNRLEENFQGINKYQCSVRLARNFEYATKECLFHNDDEVALIPPVSGG